MHHHRILFVCTIIAMAVSATALAANGSADAARRGQDAAAEKPELQLKKGMAAEAVIALMGKPADKTPMKTPSGKAEVWVYTRVITDTPTQFEVGSKQITDTVIGSDGMARTVVVSTEPIYKMGHLIKEEEISLLMFNDHFLQAKISPRERRVHD